MIVCFFQRGDLDALVSPKKLSPVSPFGVRTLLRAEAAEFFLTNNFFWLPRLVERGILAKLIGLLECVFLIATDSGLSSYAPGGPNNWN